MWQYNWGYIYHLINLILANLHLNLLALEHHLLLPYLLLCPLNNILNVLVLNLQMPLLLPPLSLPVYLIYLHHLLEYEVFMLS